jgi:nucleotide-binding universal stress UspA family protein
MWDDVIAPEVESLRAAAEQEASATGAEFTVEAGVGAPADTLIALSGEVDLLVIGSRRWGPALRVLLGSTGEELMRDARCSVMVVPCPSRWAGSSGTPSTGRSHDRLAAGPAPSVTA